MTKLEIVKQKLESLPDGSGSILLDDIVHDLYSALASDRNNNGVEKQLEFIVQQVGGEDDAAIWLERMLNLPDVDAVTPIET